MVEEAHFELIRETFKRTTEATPDRGLVWRTAVLLMRRVTNGDRDPGLCPYKGSILNI